jgi:hypothetical protein
MYHCSWACETWYLGILYEMFVSQPLKTSDVSHGTEDVDRGLLCCDAVHSCRWLQMSHYVIFYPEYGGNTLLQNVGNNAGNKTTRSHNSKDHSREAFLCSVLYKGTFGRNSFRFSRGVGVGGARTSEVKRFNRIVLGIKISIKIKYSGRDSVRDSMGGSLRVSSNKEGSGCSMFQCSWFWCSKESGFISLPSDSKINYL